jgi:hypothetical protein
MFRFYRTGLCLTLLCGSLITGCNGNPGPVSVAPPAVSPMRILTNHQPRPGIQAVDQFGNFNDVILNNPPNFISIFQAGNRNFADVDELNGPLRIRQFGNGNQVHDEEED